MIMIRASILSVALLLANGSAGAQANLVGSWEGCQSEFGSFVEHFYIEFKSTGHFRRVAFRDDSEHPATEDQGQYEAADGVVTLRYTADVSGMLAEQSEAVPFRIVDNTLYWGAEPAIALARAAELGDELLGRWGLVNFADGTLAGHVLFRADGTYELELGGVGHSGVWSRAGSGVVHWPTEADAAGILGVPAIWTHVRISGDQLFYDIACSFTVEAVRLATAITAVSWGAIKRRLAAPPK